MVTVEHKMKAKDRRKAQKENTAERKVVAGKGEGIPQIKGYKRTKMRFF